MKKITLTAAFLLFLSINSFASDATSLQETKHHQPVLFIIIFVLAVVGVLGLIWFLNHRYQKNNPTSKNTEEEKNAETKKGDKSKKPPDYIVTSHA
jgi:cytoskeletal protein RodZ